VIRLLLNQGLPRSTVDLLNRDEWDVVHVSRCGLSAATQVEVFQRRGPMDFGGDPFMSILGWFIGFR
jgi:hypothetical protein